VRRHESRREGLGRKRRSQLMAVLMQLLTLQLVLLQLMLVLLLVLLLVRLLMGWWHAHTTVEPHAFGVGRFRG
jgi:hypothetical protein